jgi:hypothetical protein
LPPASTMRGRSLHPPLFPAAPATLISPPRMVLITTFRGLATSYWPGLRSPAISSMSRSVPEPGLTAPA